MTAIRANLSEHGVAHQRWPATDGHALDLGGPGTTAVTADGTVVQDFGPWAGPEAACGISHIRLWRHIVDERIPRVIVLEDDAELLRPVPLDIEDWDLPADCDIVFLSDRAAAGRIRHAGRVFGYADLIGGAGTEGYLVTLAGAAKLLEITTPLQDPLDFQMYAHAASIQRHDTFPHFWALPRNPAASHVRLEAYRLVPGIVRHTGAESSIGNSRHPRARFYCRLLLGLDFDGGGYGSGGYPNTSPAVTGPRHDRVSRPSAHRVTEFVRGVDLSHCPDRLAGPVTRMLAERGVNSVRLSLWVDDDTPMNLARAVRLAGTARDSGLSTWLTVHYSDTWADPGTQTKPGAWASLAIRPLIDEVRHYTGRVVTEFRRHGVRLAAVQIGNEITNGMLWAEPGRDRRGGGRPHAANSVPAREWHPGDQWVVLSELLRAAAAGVREADGSADVCLHLDRGADAEGAEWWLRYADHFGLDYDLVSLSFYPLAHENATIGRLHALESLCAARPGKGLLIGETAYPHRPITGSDRVYTATEGEFPFDPDGQRRYLATALRTLRDLPTGRGLFWWGTCFVDDSVERSVDYFRAHALFDSHWRPLPALGAFGEV